MENLRSPWHAPSIYSFSWNPPSIRASWRRGASSFVQWSRDDEFSSNRRGGRSVQLHPRKRPHPRVPLHARINLSSINMSVKYGNFIWHRGQKFEVDWAQPEANVRREIQSFIWRVQGVHLDNQGFTLLCNGPDGELLRFPRSMSVKDCFQVRIGPIHQLINSLKMFDWNNKTLYPLFPGGQRFMAWLSKHLPPPGRRRHRRQRQESKVENPLGQDWILVCQTEAPKAQMWSVNLLSLEWSKNLSGKLCSNAGSRPVRSYQGSVNA